MKKKRRRKISTVITGFLLIAVTISFFASTAMTWVQLSEVAKRNGANLLSTDIQSVLYEIYQRTFDRIQDSLLKIGYYYAFNGFQNLDDMEMLKYLEPSLGMEISVLDKDGEILISMNPDLVGRNRNELKGMADLQKGVGLGGIMYMTGLSGFYVPDTILDFDGKTQMYYAVMPGSDDRAEVMAGITKEAYRQMVHDIGVDVVRFRAFDFRSMMLVNTEREIVSSYNNEYNGKMFEHPEILDRFDTSRPKDHAGNIAFYGRNFSVISDGNLWFLEAMSGIDVFENEECYYYILKVDYDLNNDYLVAFYPKKDAFALMRRSMSLISKVELGVFFLLFVVLWLLLKVVVVDRLKKVNRSLKEITNGNLEEKVDVRDPMEFNELSNDINATVDTLKTYIAEAAARIDADLAVAKAIQESALPGVFPPYPEHKEFELYATMKAAKEVGGDFYDFYMLGDHTLGFLIADVSGKSIPGAMFMMRAKSVIKSLAESGLSVCEVFNRANLSLCRNNDARMFVTAWLGFLDLRTGEVQFACAGHNPPLLLRDGRAEYVTLRPGFVLGGVESMRYKDQFLQMRAGDTLFLYTDGVTEAMDPAEELYGDNRLREILSVKEEELPFDQLGITASLCRIVDADVNAFANGAEQSDDITMLCIRYNGSEC